MFSRTKQIATPISGSINSKKEAFGLRLKRGIKNPVLWAKFLAYVIPTAFLLYVLYMNFLPFGYQKTFTINVGGSDDTKVGEFYLEPSKNLSDRKTDDKGNTYRELNGMATATFKPLSVLKNAKITAEVLGDGISLIPPFIDFNPSTIQWDNSWDFTKEIPRDLMGDVIMFDGAAAFDGKSKLELPNSQNKFEDGPFSVYAEWTPKDDSGDGQQIVGHYNWELWQNKDNVEFRVGRMNDTQGPAYSIKYPLNADFFNTKHSALAIYNPSNNGCIDLYVDGNLAEITSLGTDKIWKDYNGDKNLSFGWTPHNYGNSPHFLGSVYKVNIISKNILPNQSKINFTSKDNGQVNIPVVSTVQTILSRIKLNAAQK